MEVGDELSQTVTYVRSQVRRRAAPLDKRAVHTVHRRRGRPPSPCICVHEPHKGVVAVTSERPESYPI